MFNFNPFSTSQDMARMSNHYEKKWLWEDNSVEIQGRIMVLAHCPHLNCHLPINQVSLQSLLYFQRYGLDRQPL